MFVNNQTTSCYRNGAERSFKRLSPIDEKTQDIINQTIKEINDMFLQIGDKVNYWGISDSKRLAPLGCLKCGKCMYSYKYFAKYGPDLGKNVYFCGSDISDHAHEFQKKLLKLSHIATENDLDERELYNAAMKPVHDEEKWIQEKYEGQIKEAKNDWTMIGTSLGVRPTSFF